MLILKKLAKLYRQYKRGQKRVAMWREYFRPEECEVWVREDLRRN